MEILIPGTGLILEKPEAPAGADAAGIGGIPERLRKTDYTLAAAFHKNRVVPLYSSRANLAVEKLLLPRLFPAGCSVKREFPIGHSRFDFLVRAPGEVKNLIEVKACSLVEYGVGMFPDAPSTRASRHIEELAVLSGKGYIPHAVFLLSHGPADFFMPNMHTDPVFARTFYRACEQVRYHAASLRCREDGLAVLEQEEVPIDYSRQELAEGDSGNYLLVLTLEKDSLVSPGALGEGLFKKGFYVYAGSAHKNLSARMARHLRKKGKKPHWHIDYLVPFSAKLRGYAISSYTNLECSLAKGLSEIGGIPVPHFGSGDCRCPSHLYYFKNDPVLDRGFVDILMAARHSVTKNVKA